MLIGASVTNTLDTLLFSLTDNVTLTKWMKPVLHNKAFVLAHMLLSLYKSRFSSLKQVD
jgi:hypothetical protein